MPRFAFPYLAGFLLLFCCMGLQAQTVTTFEGIDASQVAQPQADFDPNGAIGTKQYMEWVDTYYQAWSKTSPFTPVWSTPQNGDSPFVAAGLTNCSTIEGDGIVTFDRLASRWIIAAHNQILGPVTSYYYCVAVSTSDDLTTAGWYTYAFPLSSVLGTNSSGTPLFPDWPKFGTWADGYYVAMDVQDPGAGFLEIGIVACALDRADMLIGATALAPQCFMVPTNPTDVLVLNHSLEPADVEGTTAPPTGTPEYFISIQNPPADGVTTTTDSFNLWQFSVNWLNPAATTFSQESISSPVYTPGCYRVKAPGDTACVPEPTTASTKNYIDSVGDRFMYRFSYRNFGTYQSYLASHTVQVGTAALSQTGVRWYELRGSVPAIYQSGQISPDTTNYRFMPSITQDVAGNAAVGYSISSASMHPGIAASYWSLDTNNTPTEISLYTGSADDENTYKWGDYTDMTVDPINGCTFWYTNEYYTVNQTSQPTWQTRVANFTLPGCGAVSALPASLNFGNEGVGTTSQPLQVVLNNSQTTALTIHSIYGNGANPGDFKETNNCGSTVAAGESCTILVTFTPLATGTASATLVISDSAGNSPQRVSVTGVGVNGAALNFSTTSLVFGTQMAGTTSPASMVTVTNTGNAAASFTSIAVTGTNSTSFGESDNCQPTLNQATSCTISVTFTPQLSGSLSAAVTLTDTASGSPQSISLAGTSSAPVALSPTSLAFGSVPLGSSKTAPAVTVTNQSTAALTGISIAPTGTGYTQVNTCGTSLAAGASCKITVTFTPTVVGATPGTVSITDSAVTSPQTITLTGTGQQPVALNPTTLSFGKVTVGTTSPAKTITLTNNQKTALTFTSFTITGGDAPGDYAVTANTCGSSLAASSKCTIGIAFTPQAKGSRQSTLQISDSAVNSPQSVNLGGTGQ